MSVFRKLGVLSVSVVAALGLLGSGVASAEGLDDLLGAPPAGESPTASVDQASLEASFVQLINASRAEAGLPPLSVRVEILPVARTHSDAMAASGSIWHNASLAQAVTAGWRALGENVGMGWSVESLHDAFMSSPGHRANVLGDFDQVTIAVAAGTGSEMFVTEVFWSTASAPTAVAAPAKAAPAAKAKVKVKVKAKAKAKAKAKKKAVNHKKATTKSVKKAGAR